MTCLLLSKAVCVLQFLQQLDLWELFLGKAADLAWKLFFFFLSFFLVTNENVKHVPTRKYMVLISFSEAGKLWESRYLKSSKRDSNLKRLRVLQCWTSNVCVMYFWSSSPAAECSLRKKKNYNFVISCFILVGLTVIEHLYSCNFVALNKVSLLP